MTTTDPWYTAADTPELVDPGPATGLGVTGSGAPGGETYVDSVGAVYAVAARLALPGLPPLEGQWWVESDRPPFEVPRDEWRWHLFLRLPDTVEPAHLEAAREQARKRVPSAARVQLVTMHEGPCVQVMHHGPYADEPRTLARMSEFMAESGVTHNGLHHEIYLTDMRHTPAAEARTILRQPVRST